MPTSVIHEGRRNSDVLILLVPFYILGEILINRHLLHLQIGSSVDSLFSILGDNELIHYLVMVINTYLKAISL